MWLLLWFVLSSLAGAQLAPHAPSDLETALGDRLSHLTTQTGRDQDFGSLTPGERREVIALYAAAPGQPLWVDAAWRPTPDAAAALSLLRNSRVEGLDPDDYGVSSLTSWSDALTRTPAVDDAATFDIGLSLWTLRYLRHLHHGRVDPRTVGFDVTVPSDEHDFAGLLRSAVSSHGVAALVTAFEPPLSQYRTLREHLAVYRALAESASERPVAPAKSLLDVPLSWRVRQIELAMERLRWLPDLQGEPVIVVNVAMFRFWGSTAVGSEEAVPIEGKVIVGRAGRTPTPLFIGDMREVIFRPYWNVPSSIVWGEILPAVRRDPDYLRKHDMELVHGNGDAAVPVEMTAANVARLGRDLNVRQRPGPANSLGLVKFNFPNAHDVYMHGTPQQQLFKQDRRDFSHGCIRVEDPTALAEWVLASEGDWPRKRIVDAMHGSVTLRVELSRPIHVLVLYTTALVTPGDSAIHFVRDVYGQDARLDAALTNGAQRQR